MALIMRPEVAPTMGTIKAGKNLGCTIRAGRWWIGGMLWS